MIVSNVTCYVIGSNIQNGWYGPLNEEWVGNTESLKGHGRVQKISVEGKKNNEPFC
ncbi:hypothetical protein LDENG_00267600, partial [Lucifuga dentata]